MALKKFFKSIELLRVNAGTSRENSREGGLICKSKKDIKERARVCKRKSKER